MDFEGYVKERGNKELIYQLHETLGCVPRQIHDIAVSFVLYYIVAHFLYDLFDCCVLFIHANEKYLSDIRDTH